MSLPPTHHIPVLLEEVIRWLVPQPGAVVVDGTLGGGGHARALAERVGPAGRVIAVDRDPGAVEAAAQRLAGLPLTAVHGNFADLPELLRELELPAVDAIMLDLGMSSDQLADLERGFSFDADGPLDLRFDPGSGEPASRLVNRLDERRLAELIRRYGEERFSRRIARAIVEQRRQAPIRTARQLAQVVRGAVPRRGPSRIDPATRTFQALRIAVNQELTCLETALKRFPECLKPGGRVAIISFHSLEDRRVKQAFRDDPRYKVLSKKPIRPKPEEIALNPRARSAKLRVAVRQ